MKKHFQSWKKSLKRTFSKNVGRTLQISLQTPAESEQQLETLDDLQALAHYTNHAVDSTVAETAVDAQDTEKYPEAPDNLQAPSTSHPPHADQISASTGTVRRRSASLCHRLPPGSVLPPQAADTAADSVEGDKRDEHECLKWFQHTKNLQAEDSQAEVKEKVASPAPRTAAAQTQELDDAVEAPGHFQPDVSIPWPRPRSRRPKTEEEKRERLRRAQEILAKSPQLSSEAQEKSALERQTREDQVGKQTATTARFFGSSSLEDLLAATERLERRETVITVMSTITELNSTATPADTQTPCTPESGDELLRDSLRHSRLRDLTHRSKDDLQHVQGVIAEVRRDNGFQAPTHLGHEEGLYTSGPTRAASSASQNVDLGSDAALMSIQERARNVSVRHRRRLAQSQAVAEPPSGDEGASRTFTLQPIPGYTRPRSTADQLQHEIADIAVVEDGKGTEDLQAESKYE